MTVVPGNGSAPVQSWYNTHPRLNKSPGASTSSPRACSGDMYAGVPTAVPGLVMCTSWLSVRASPKSRILTLPMGASSQMLAGLMSRWTRPRLWAAARPAAISRPSRSTRSSDGLCPRSNQRCRDIP